MTVEELEKILSTIKDKDLEVVCTSGYYTNEINGYFFSDKDEREVLMLTPLNVKPRIPSKHEV